MRLKLVREVDFRKNEATNWNSEVIKRQQLAMKPNDVVCFFSQTRNQVLFVWRPDEIKFGRRGLAATVYRSQRLRLSNGTWDVLMLQNYAEKCGIHLDGIRRFEDLHQRLVKETRKELKLKTEAKVKVKAKHARGKDHLRLVA